MYQIPIGFGPVPNPIDMGSLLVADLSFGMAVWLAVAAVAYLALLPLALRRREPERTEIATDAVLLRTAA